jgi:hypothetical protein
MNPEPHLISELIKAARLADTPPPEPLPAAFAVRVAARWADAFAVPSALDLLTRPWLGHLAMALVLAALVSALCLEPPSAPELPSTMLLQRVILCP